MKHFGVPGTRIETCPNIPIVPCMLSIRASVAVFSRNSFSSLIGFPFWRLFEDLPQAGVAIAYWPRRLGGSVRPSESISDARNFCSCAGGGLCTGMVPSLTINALTSGVAAAAASSALRRSTIGFGVAAGTETSVQPTASKPGTPASAMVGTSGSTGTRVVDDTPSGRTMPALIWPVTLPASANIRATWPPMTSLRPSGAPR